MKSEYVRKRSEYQKATVARYKELGLCKCGSKALPDMRSCQSCLDKSKKWYQERGRMKYLERRKAREKQGLCVTCGINPVSDRKTCKECAEKERIRYVRLFG